MESARDEPGIPPATDGARVILAGDVMLGRLMNDVLARFGALYPWGDTVDCLRAADLAIVNLECVIASDGVPWSRTPKVFHFRADPVAIDALKLAGVDAVTLANNHVLDFDEDSMLEMLRRLDQAGIAHCGAGRDLTEAERPAMVTARGAKIGIVSFTDNEPVWAAGTSSPGTNYIPIALTSRVVGRVRRAIQATRSRGADIVVFASHWGPNMRQRPSERFRDFARAVMDAGADVFFGHSAHIIQGVEIYRHKPIIYDAGDFVDDYAVDAVLRNDQSLLFELTVTDQKVAHMTLYPVLIQNFQVNHARGGEFDEIAERIGELSAQMGTVITRKDDRLSVTLSAWRPSA